MQDVACGERPASLLLGLILCSDDGISATASLVPASQQQRDDDSCAEHETELTHDYLPHSIYGTSCPLRCYTLIIFSQFLEYLRFLC